MFSELLSNPTAIEPGLLQTLARQRFASIVQNSHLEHRVVSHRVPSNGRYIIIGVASYSPLELQLLDDVDAAYPQWKDTAKVAVFDLMECKDMNELNKLLLKVASVTQTPVVAMWDGGKVVAFETGLHKTREVLQNARLLK